MLIVALVLAVIGLAALVTAVVTSNEIVAWVCIGASGLGVLLLVVDAIRDRARRGAMAAPVAAGAVVAAAAETEVIEPEESTEVIESVEAGRSPEAPDLRDADMEDLEAEIADEDHPEEVVHDEPDYDLPSDDEQEFPESAEEAAIHTVDEDYLAAQDAEDQREQP